MIKLIVAILFSSSVGLCLLGGKESGGNFEFYHTEVEKVLSQSQILAAQIVTRWPDQVWRHKYFSKSVNKEKLIRLILETRHNEEKEMWRNDPSELKEPLIMNFSTDEKGDYIEFLLPYFREIKERLRRYENIQDIQLDTAQALVHEALHHFNYSEDEAYGASRFVYGFDDIVACDGVANRFPDYECVFPTPDRLEHVRNLLKQWVAGKGPQSYEILIGAIEHWVLKIDLMTQVNKMNLQNLKVSTSEGEFKNSECSIDGSTLDCSTPTGEFSVSLSKPAMRYSHRNCPDSDIRCRGGSIGSIPGVALLIRRK